MANVWRLIFRCQHSNGALVEPSLHYQTDLAIGGEEPSADDVATKVWDHVGAAFRAAHHPDVTIHELVAWQEVLKPDIAEVGGHTVELVGSGFAANFELPHAVCPTIDLRTATHSRSARGWTKLGCPGQAASISGDHWQGAYVTAWNALCELLDDTIQYPLLDPRQLHPVVYSRTRRKRAESPWTFNVTSAKLNPVPGFLRSRYTVP